MYRELNQPECDFFKVMKELSSRISRLPRLMQVHNLPSIVIFDYKIYAIVHEFFHHVFEYYLSDELKELWNKYYELIFNNKDLMKLLKRCLHDYRIQHIAERQDSGGNELFATLSEKYILNQHAREALDNLFSVLTQKIREEYPALAKIIPQEIITENLSHLKNTVFILISWHNKGVEILKNLLRETYKRLWGGISEEDKESFPGESLVIELALADEMILL